MGTMRPLLNVRQAAAYLGLGLSTIKALVHRRELPHVKLGSRVLFRLEDLERWVAARIVPAADEDY